MSQYAAGRSGWVQQLDAGCFFLTMSKGQWVMGNGVS